MENKQEIEDKKIIETMIEQKKYRLCPNCKIVTDKISGCNYLKCAACKSEWCWECEKIKFKPDGCNDKSHNSH